jgi:dimethylargininase
MRWMIALTRGPSPSMQACERTFVSPVAIDVGRAAEQHANYCRVLRECGAQVRTLEANERLPDSGFIEDTAIVLDEVAVLCSMGAASRRDEPAGIESVLREYREVVRIELPGTIEGGDVLRVGRKLLVGLSCRTNAAGIAALQTIVGRYGYEVTPVGVRGCLHLKTACTALPDGRLLVNSAWIDRAAIDGYELVQVPREEPWGANVALIGQSVLMEAAHDRTAGMISDLGFDVRTVDLGEFAKAEGGVTCLSLLLESGPVG